jgi:ubiquinone/menaquinone biosynthesis C-methylase UbiE
LMKDSSSGTRISTTACARPSSTVADMTSSLRVLPALLVTLLIPAAVSAQAAAFDTAKIFAAIGVREGATVCEIGAGDGELSIAAAKAVGPQGRIFTSELGEGRLKQLRTRVESANLPQITVVDGDASRTNFAEASCDALFMRNVYHHFLTPSEMNLAIAAALKPGARLAIVDFAPPGAEASCPADRGKDGMHGVTADTVSRELREAGFEAVASESGAQRWFMVVVARPRT